MRLLMSLLHALPIRPHLACVLGAVLLVAGCDRSSKPAPETKAPAPAATTAAQTAPPAGAVQLDRIRLPPGFTIDTFATGVENARSMALSDKGTLFVGTRELDRVYALIDKNGDNRADETRVIARGLRKPNGIAYHKGSLYVGEINRVLRYDAVDDHLDQLPEPVPVVTGLPNDDHHGWKYLRFGPDGMLYFAVGAPCNICERPDDPRYASILRVAAAGGTPEIYAKGVRNSVGFDFQPQTGDLWFTDNGRDMLGDDLPPDELNHAPRPGMHFGYPYCHGAALPDPELNQGKLCSSYEPPALAEGAHVAGLGFRFYTGTQFPEQYRGDLFIAQHGSWNRSKKSGYRVMRVHLVNNQVDKYEVFAEGWLGTDETAWGRPVDVLQTPDGSLLVSDDQAGAIYRIHYAARG
jgi:glucose/arabinose dehydrogenase